MAFPTLATEAAKAKRILTKRFGRKERALLASVQNGLDAATGGVTIIKAGLFTTAGGDKNESITVTGAAATDVCIVTVNTEGSTPCTITTAKCGTDKIDVEMSGDPSTDHVLNYIVVRPAT